MRAGPKYFRAGVFGTTNAVIGVIGVLVFGALVGATALSVTAGQNVVWSTVGGVLALGALAVCAAVAASGMSTWRPVRLNPGPHGVLSVPGFTVRRGFYRDEVRAGDVLGVRLEYRSEPRNGRWQLVVTPRGGRSLACDSVTCSRSARCDVSGSAAATVVRALAAAFEPASP